MSDDWYIGTVMSTLSVPERLIRIDDLVLRYSSEQAEAIKPFRPGMTVRYKTSVDKKTLTAIEQKAIVPPAPSQQPVPKPTPPTPVEAPITTEASATPRASSSLPWERHEDYSVSICATVNLENYENIRVEFSGRATSGSDIDLMVTRMDETLSRFGTDDATKARISAYRKRVIGRK